MALPLWAGFYQELPETLSEQSKVSLVTMGPGNMPHTIFGHSVIRIEDPVYDIDVMVNYGVYNMNQENFYLKFLDGTAQYSGAVQDSDITIIVYSYSEISIVQQELSLTYEQRLHLLSLIEQSLQPEHKYYRYDFFFDNCATRIRDLLDQATHGALFPEHAEGQGLTIRQWIDTKALPGYPLYDYVYDLFLGRAVDREISYKDEMFLPDMLARGVALAEIEDVDGSRQSLVKSTYPLNDYGEDTLSTQIPNASPAFGGNVEGYIWGIQAEPAPLRQNPALWWWFLAGLALLMVLLSIVSGRGGVLLTISFGLYMTILGILGVIFLLASIFSLHEVTHNNTHIWWMWPTHLFMFLGLAIKRIRTFLNLYVLFWLAGVVGSGLYMAMVFPQMGAFLPMQVTGVILGIWYLMPKDSRERS